MQNSSKKGETMEEFTRGMILRAPDNDEYKTETVCYILWEQSDIKLYWWVIVVVDGKIIAPMAKIDEDSLKECVPTGMIQGPFSMNSFTYNKDKQHARG